MKERCSLSKTDSKKTGMLVLAAVLVSLFAASCSSDNKDYYNPTNYEFSSISPSRDCTKDEERIIRYSPVKSVSGKRHRVKVNACVPTDSRTLFLEAEGRFEEQFVSLTSKSTKALGEDTEDLMLKILYNIGLNQDGRAVPQSLTISLEKE